MGTFDPGWYADPMGSGNQRYWDGTQWSSHTASLDGNQSNDNLAVLSPEELASWAAAAHHSKKESPAAGTNANDSTQMANSGDVADPMATQITDPEALQAAKANTTIVSPAGGVPTVALSGPSAPPASALDIPPARPNAPFAPVPLPGPNNPAGPFAPRGPAFANDGRGVRPSTEVFLAEAPPEGATTHPATGWILVLIIAGLQILNQFLPLFSIDGADVLPNLDQAGDTSWTLIVTGLIVAAAFTTCGLFGREGRTTWISLATGFALILVAQNSIDFATLVELLTSDFIDTTPGAGFVSVGVTVVLSLVLAIITLPRALSHHRGSLNPLVAGVITLAMAFLVYSMSQTHHDIAGRFWFSEAKLQSLTFLAPTVVLAIISLLVILVRNTSVAALAAGATFPFGLEHLLRRFTDPPNLGNASFIFAEEKVGIPALVVFVVGIFAAGVWGRRLYQPADDSPILDLRSPQRVLAIAGPAVVVLALAVGLAANEISNPFAGSTSTLFETSSVGANSSKSHQIKAATTSDYEIYVNGNSVFDAVIDVYVDDMLVATVDDYAGSADPFHFLFVNSGQTIRVEVSGFQGAAGSYSISISGA